MERCPYCGENKIFVGVHDDEGNYHGDLGCEYESDPWSGLSYALHHLGWGECILCTDGVNEVMGGMLFDSVDEAIAAFGQQGFKVVEIDQVKNEPLTLEEMQKIAGSEEYGAHIWVKEMADHDVIAAVTDIILPYGIVALWSYSEHEPAFTEQNYGIKWLAYRNKPEEEK